jgi:hypothetical protein
VYGGKHTCHPLGAKQGHGTNFTNKQKSYIENEKKE